MNLWPPALLATYFAVGLCAGAIGGLLGLAGGIVIVPALLFLFLWQGFPAATLMQQAVATSLCTILFTAAGATWTHHRHGAVLWRQVRRLSPGLCIGGVLGATVADAMPTTLLRRCVGVFEILVAVQLLAQILSVSPRAPLGAVGTALAGGMIGALSVLMGIGGGTFTVQFLLWHNVGMRRAIATAAACGFPIALTGVLSMIVAGWSREGLPSASAGYVHLPAAIAVAAGSIVSAAMAAHWTHSLPVQTLRRIFAFVLATIGVYMVT